MPIERALYEPRRRWRPVDPDPTLTVTSHDDVYRPSEDSLLLLAGVRVEPGERFLELGTGNGFIALHAAKRGARVVATDVSPHAVQCARTNAIKNRLPVAVVQCDLLRGLRGTFDIIAFNPPYLAEEIRGPWAERAWQGGPIGDDVILSFLREAREHVAPGGRIYVLIPGNRDRALALAESTYRVRIAAKKPLFFETLFVFELPPK